MISVSNAEREPVELQCIAEWPPDLERLSSWERDSCPAESSSGLQGRFAVLGSPGSVCYRRPNILGPGFHPGEFPQGWKPVEVGGSRSVVFCGQSTYKSSMCFDDSLPFHRDVKNPGITRF
jgi:hypothetical protein